MRTYNEKSIALHRAAGGKLSVQPKVPLESREDMTLAYTPGVAAVCELIKNDPREARRVTSTKRTVAIVTDGSAVLGLGNIGPVASLPVMEGKAVIFRRMAGVDAFPIALSVASAEELVETVCRLAPTFGGINLEDIAAPRCFEVERALIEQLDIPVFHDDQHGTAIVVLAGLLNALTVVGKELPDVKIVVNGAGAAGIAITRLLASAGARRVHLVDSQGVVSRCRIDLAPAKQEMLECCVVPEICGSLEDVLEGADVFIGVSKAGVLTADHVAAMASDSIVFALANPDPEISPHEAMRAGARIVATGRSDFPNQINNALVFPGLFKGLLEYDVRTVSQQIKLSVARALADVVKVPTAERIIPDIFDDRVVHAIVSQIGRVMNDNGR